MNTNVVDPKVLEAAQPLSPGDFALRDNPPGKTGSADPSNFPGEGEDDDVTLDTSDLLTVQAALNLLRAARVGARSADINAASESRLEIIQLISYLTGFLDAKGPLPAPLANAGFDVLLGKSVQPSMDLSLDQFDAALVQVISSPATRSWHGWRNKVARVLDYASQADTALGVAFGAAAGVALFAPTP
jgi:hypothetical protein